MIVTVWVWDELTGVTHAYHADGAAVVISDSWSRAVELLREAAPSYFVMTDDELAQPSHVFHPGQNSGPEQVIIFPDAGCC